MKTVRAIYENGVLRPLDPVSLTPGVELTLEIHETSDESAEGFAELSNDAFTAIWDNEDDAAYDRFLPG